MNKRTDQPMNKVRQIILSFCLVWLTSFSAVGTLMARHTLLQTDTLRAYRYRLTFTDKQATTYSLNHPEAFLSAKALERRSRQGLQVDSTDLPLCNSYVEAITQLDVKPVARGKWENFLTVACTDTLWLAQVRRLPFVKRVECVWMTPPFLEEATTERDPIDEQWTHYPDTLYGAAWRQIEMLRGDSLHAAGFRGEGMTIAVIDAGFHNADRMKLMKKVHILGVRDFVNPGGTPFGEGAHGLSVLSCMATNRPEVMVGTAPEASYWLLRSEDEASEQLVEQDYWAAAVEFADSVGVDVVNTSLGYYTFDNPTWNYAYRHLNGSYALMSRQASRMATKGMVLVCRAGNSGAGRWKKITPPADAFEVLTVGAVDKEAELANFSSVGHTADGRIKPDVVALGEHTAILRANGSPGRGNGTSYSAPVVCGLVACLWQALPQLTVHQLLDLVRQSGDRASYPDNIYGYGLPNFWRAYQQGCLLYSKPNTHQSTLDSEPLTH